MNYHTREKSYAMERSSCDLRCRVQYGAVAAPPAAAKVVNTVYPEQKKNMKRFKTIVFKNWTTR